ncbi:MAG TPA: cysteine synthase A [Candidatus Dormibacteraeota bacterium]
MNTILDAAGLTPVVKLRKVAPAGVEVLCKVEFFGPSGSVKDRILPHIVSRAIERGELREGMTIIEGTTGNTGIATSMVGAALGFPVTIVMPEGMSEERKKTIVAYGAKLVLTPGAESDVDLVLEKVAELKAEEAGRYYQVGQFTNQDNVEAHYRATGPELWEQLGGKVDAFVASQGTGGTITGIGRYLKEQNPAVKIFAVEPSECPILSGGDWGSHRIEGIGDGFVPEVLDLNVLDGVIQVSSDEAIEMARRLAREEGIFCGISSGCNVAASVKLFNHGGRFGRIATVLNDNGLRYLSTELCGGPVVLDTLERDHESDHELSERLRRAALEVIA